MIYITGDTHGDFERIIYFSKMMNTTIQDVLIILGDAGLNYHLNERDEKKKNKLKKLKLTVLCIRGNHEQRPEVLPKYRKRRWRGGVIYVERAFPNILFAQDGSVFDLEGISAIAIGGAYSVDKYFRLDKGMAWFDNEQLTTREKCRIERVLVSRQWKIDIVLSHTIPLKYEPREIFLPMIDQSTVDKSTETWLDYIEDKLMYSKWYCGHYHTKKTVDKVQILYDDYVELSSTFYTLTDYSIEN